MKKKMIISLLVIVCLILTGCNRKQLNNNEELNDSGNTTINNQELGWMKFYVPDGFEYRPDLRGLAYDETERKLFIKGDPQDRSTAIIIDAIKQEVDEYFIVYIDKLNSYINNEEERYRLISEKPQMYAREKYQGKSGDTIIYNYTYVLKYYDYVYTVTISGPQSKENELVELKNTISKAIQIG